MAWRGYKVSLGFSLDLGQVTLSGIPLNSFYKYQRINPQ